MRFNKIALIVGVAVALFGFFLFSIGAFNLHRYTRLTSETPATVVNIGTRTHNSGGQQDSITYSWRITLQYDISGIAYERRLTWSSHNPTITLNEGDIITILYDPGNPQRIGWVGTGRIGGAWYMMIVGFAFFATGFIVAVRQYIAWRKQEDS